MPWTRVAVGALATIGISQKILCRSMEMYEIINEVYEAVGKYSGKKYSISMKQGKLCVEQVRREVIDCVLRTDTNIIESSYSVNGERVVNKVKIYDENNQYLGVVRNDELIRLLDIFQDAYIMEDDKQAKAVVQSM